MADHVACRAVSLKAVDTDGRHRGSRALVKADREVELLGHRPERLVYRVADYLAVYWAPNRSGFSSRGPDRAHRSGLRPFRPQAQIAEPNRDKDRQGAQEDE